MAIILNNGTFCTRSGRRKTDILIREDGSAVFDVPDASGRSFPDAFSGAGSAESIDCSSFIILPGFTDVHVHFREPGFSYKETIATGSRAAARGGYTCVCAMPNLDPAPSTLEALQAELGPIRRDALIRVVPYGTITEKRDGRSRLSEMEALAPFVAGFSDDGCGVQDRALMRDAMERAAVLGKIITAHCEDNALLGGTAIHDGEFARSIGHRGITSESEWRQIERDVKLADETGCAYHVCHISTRESVEILRDAKASGVNVSCETAPHYLTLCDRDLFGIDPEGESGGRFRMNPPLRSRADQEALLEGCADGTVDMIATDHAPHSAEEKSRGLLKSASGIVGLETAFPVLYTKLVLGGVLPLERLADMMCFRPAERFGLPLPALPGDGGTSNCGFTVIDPETTFMIDPETFAGKGRVVMTLLDGRSVYDGRSADHETFGPSGERKAAFDGR